MISAIDHSIRRRLETALIGTKARHVIDHRVSRAFDGADQFV